VLAGYGRFGRELVGDLRGEGLAVTIIDPSGAPDDPSVIVGDASEPAVLERADLRTAVGFVAGTDNDTTNLSLAASARRINPGLFLAARQNQQASAPLFQAMELDSLLVPTEVVAHEMYAQLSTPMLWRFVQEIPTRGNEWAAHLMERITASCGRRLQELWKVRMVPGEAPALFGRVRRDDIRLGDVLRNPDDRDRRLDIVPLLVQRRQDSHLTPDDDFVLQPDDELLLAGRSQDRRAMDNTLYDEAACEYVLFDRHVPSSWIWRKLSGAARSGVR
jgi:Trk K+ transport system NAD-binding subunit